MHNSKQLIVAPFHLFRVNNFTTYLVAKLIIRRLRLVEGQYKFLTARNLKTFTEDQEYTVVSPYPYAPEPFPVKRKFWKGRDRLAKFDLFVESLTGGRDFAYYATNFSRRVNQLFASHPKCTEVNFLEEGMACYQPRSYLENLTRSYPSTIYKVRQFLSYGRRLRPWGFASDLDNYYTITDVAMPGYEIENVYAEADMLAVLRAGPVFSLPEAGSVVYVIDAAASIGLVSIEEYIAAVRKSFEFIQKRGTEQYARIYLKFHPEQGREERQAFVNAFLEDGAKVNYVPDKIPLESLLFGEQKCLFVGNISSVLFYAAYFGKEVRSLHSLFEKKHALKLPAIYWDYVKAL